MQKKHVFLIRFPWPKKCENSDQQAAQGPHRRERGTTFWELGPQGGAFSRARLPVVKGKTEVGQFEQAKGKKESWQAEQKKVRRGI